MLGASLSGHSAGVQRKPPDPSSAVIEVAVGKAVGISCFAEKKEEKDYVCMGANKLQQKPSQQQ